MMVRTRSEKFVWIMLVCLFALSGCFQREMNVVTLGDETFEQVSLPEATVHRIFVATTRARSEDPIEFFSGDRSQDLTLGWVDVSVPNDREIGSIRVDSDRPIDPAKSFAVGTPKLLEDVAQFQSSMNEAVRARPDDVQDVLVFVHGYNTTFSKAVLRISQFVHDTGYKGLPVLFSWASRGQTLDYIYDLNSALQAVDRLEDLGVILTGVRSNNYDVVAHSMGNFLTLEAMRRLQKRTDLNARGALRRVIMASPDVDFDLFSTQIKDFDGVKDRFYVLVSADDRALQLSRRLAGGVERLGAADPRDIAALGVNVIDLTKIDDRSNINHSKFADSPEIVRLIGRSIADGNTLDTDDSGARAEQVVGEIFRSITFIPETIVGSGASFIVELGSNQ